MSLVPRPQDVLTLLTDHLSICLYFIGSNRKHVQPADIGLPTGNGLKETKLQPGTAGPGNRLGSCLVSFHFLWAILCPQAVHWRIVILSKSTSRCEQSRKVQKGEICQLVPRPATYLALVGFENSSSRQHFLQVVTEQTQPYPRHAMCNFITAHKSQPLAITKYRGGKFAQK